MRAVIDARRRSSAQPSPAEALNRGVALGVPLRTADYVRSLAPDRPYTSAEIWDRACQAATLSLCMEICMPRQLRRTLPPAK